MVNSTKFVHSLNSVIFFAQILQLLLLTINLAITSIRAENYAWQFNVNSAATYTGAEILTIITTLISVVVYALTVLSPRSPLARFASAHRRLINISRPLLRLSVETGLVIFWVFIVIIWIGDSFGFCRDNGGCGAGWTWHGPGDGLMGANGDLLMANAGMAAIIWGLTNLVEMGECCGGCGGRKERQTEVAIEKAVELEEMRKDEKGYASVPPPPSSHVSTSTGRQRLSGISEGLESNVTGSTMTTLPPYRETDGLNAVVDKACR